MTAIAEVAEQSRLALHAALVREFGPDELAAWEVEIEPDNTVRFRSPDVLFRAGSEQLTERYRQILAAFFPRYLRVLYRHDQAHRRVAGDGAVPEGEPDPGRGEIYAINIEGHTSEDWGRDQDLSTRYIKNMKLSQDRAYETLRFCYCLFAAAENRECADAARLATVGASIEPATLLHWLHSTLKANGRSFAEPRESAALSRRVEFRVITRAEERLYAILERSRATQGNPTDEASPAEPTL